MKTLRPEQQHELLAIARGAFTRPPTDVVVTPWLLALPPWKWIAKKPFVGSLLVCLVLLVLTTLGTSEPLTIELLVRHGVILVDVFIGFFGVFFFANQYRSIYGSLKNITLLPPDTLARWFNENVSRLWGSVNLRPVDKRVSYGLWNVLRHDITLFVWFAFWTVFITLISLAATRNLPPELSPRWVARSILAFFWAFSFVWSAHTILHSLAFIVQLGKLPVHYFFGMPREMSLKSIGRVFVIVAWYGSLHFWFFLLILYQWDAISPHASEPVMVTAIITYATVAGCILYLGWQFMLVVGTQVVLSYTMRRYKTKRAAEYSFHIEKEFESFLHNPGEETFARLEGRAKQGHAVLSRLPGFSLSGGDLAAFLLLVFIDIALLYLFLARSGLTLGHFWELGRSLYSF